MRKLMSGVEQLRAEARVRELRAEADGLEAGLAGGAPDEGDRTAARAVGLRADAQELENEVLRGTHVTPAEAEELLDGFRRGVEERLRRLPAEHAGELAALARQGRGAVEARLRELAHAALADVEDMLPRPQGRLS